MIQGSIYAKLCVIGVLILVLQIPISLIEGLIYERINTKQEAESFISRNSGGQQIVVAPTLSIPYTYRYTDDKQRQKSYRAYAQLLPDSLKVSSKVTTETRHRGIFEVPVYISTLEIKGTFGGIAVVPPNVAEQDIHWSEAVFNVGISDPKTIRVAEPLEWKGIKTEPEPGTKGGVFGENGIHFPAGLTGPLEAGKPENLNLKVSFTGTENLQFIPVGRTTEISMTSDWPHPSFIGSYLPETRRIESGGFEVSWKILDLGRSFPRVIYGSEDVTSKISGVNGSAFGVGFYSPVDAHRMSERALKYELFVIALTFLTFAMFEIFSGIKIHSIQYLLVGAALTLFYLLLLSLSEHIGFAAAYGFASLFVLILVAGYSRSVLKQKSGATVVGFSLSLLYGFFFTLLQEQDYSLVIGSLGLTAILGVVMYLTRNIDWYAIGKEREAIA